MLCGGSLGAATEAVNLKRTSTVDNWPARALRVLLPFIFSELNLHRIEAACIPTNKASVRVLEKCGFVREGLARRYLCINGIWQDHLLFGLLNEDLRG